MNYGVIPHSAVKHTTFCQAGHKNRKGVFMKKLCLVLVLAAVAVGVWAQEQEQPKKGGFSLSAGAGGYFTSDFGGGYEVTRKVRSSGGGTVAGATEKLPTKTPYSGGGGFAFFDATYAEVSLGFFAASGKYQTNNGYDPDSAENPNKSYPMSFTGLDIGLLGKYPFAIKEKLSLFPLLGITYRAVLSAKMEDAEMDDAGDFSALWFRLGCGLDYAFTDHIYLRGGILYGIRLASKAENDGVDKAEDDPLCEEAKTVLGQGLEIKLAVGYKF
jgi:hypothetical protein